MYRDSGLLKKSRIDAKSINLSKRWVPRSSESSSLGVSDYRLKRARPSSKTRLSVAPFFVTDHKFFQQTQPAGTGTERLPLRMLKRNRACTRPGFCCLYVAMDSSGFWETVSASLVGALLNRTPVAREIHEYAMIRAPCSD